MSNNKNAGILLRLLSALLDKAIFKWILFLFLLPFILRFDFSSLETGFISLGHILTAFVVYLLVNFLFVLWYNTYFVSKFGGNFGTLLMGLRVIDRNSDMHLSKKRAFFRTFAGIAFSTQFLFLGYWKILKDSDNHAWHDDLFDTRVAVRGKSWMGILLLILLDVGLIFALIAVISGHSSDLLFLLQQLPKEFV